MRRLRWPPSSPFSAPVSKIRLQLVDERSTPVSLGSACTGSIVCRPTERRDAGPTHGRHQDGMSRQEGHCDGAAATARSDRRDTSVEHEFTSQLRPLTAPNQSFKVSLLVSAPLGHENTRPPRVAHATLTYQTRGTCIGVARFNPPRPRRPSRPRGRACSGDAVRDNRRPRHGRLRTPEPEKRDR